MGTVYECSFSAWITARDRWEASATLTSFAEQFRTLAPSGRVTLRADSAPEPDFTSEGDRLPMLSCRVSLLVESDDEPIQACDTAERFAALACAAHPEVQLTFDGGCTWDDARSTS